MTRRYTYIVWGLFSLSLLLPLAMITLPAQRSFQTLTLYLSAIVGYMGVTMLLWMLVLGLRGVSGLAGRQLNHAYRLHSIIGKYGTIGILLHPVLVTLSYHEQWYYSLVPRLGGEFERAVLWGQVAALVLVVVWVSSALLREKIGWRPWKYLHLLAYAAVPFALLHIPDTGSNFAAQLAVKIYFFAMVLLVLVIALAWLRSPLNLDKYGYEVRYHTQINDRVYALTLRPLNANLRLKPAHGQYVYLKTGFFSEDHPFSVLTHDESSGVITVAYKVFGRFTRRLTQLPVGATVMLSGPFGQFTHDVTTQPAVFVAGGIGVTPFVGRLLDESSAAHWLFYANRSQHTAVFEDALRERLQERYVPLYSDEADRPSLIEAIQARVQDMPSRDYYLCGPAGMMASCRAALIAQGVPAAQIYSEDFSY